MWNTEKKSYLESREQRSEAAGQMTQERWWAEAGSFKARKITKLPHQGFYVAATSVMIQECKEKAGT